MTDGRNFRSHYYEKVGFRGVEEKKSLQILLKEDPLDIGKLSMFCLRFQLSAMFRPLVWKVILGIVPPHPSTHDFVMQQRSEQFSDLRNALRVMGHINHTTALSSEFLKMFLLEERRLPLEDEQLAIECQEEECFISLAETVIELFDNEVDAYWITATIRRNLIDKDSFLQLSQRFVTQLQKEDSQLLKHLETTGVLSRMGLVYKAWFGGMFAGVIPPGPLGRVMDRLIGGAPLITVYVAQVFVLTYRRQLLGMTKYDAIVQFLLKVPPDSAEVLVNEAIETWESCRSQTKPDTL
ncbi:TBC1 domain family member 7-like [Asterias rubens]|uniref:TBC1 domain family member 7-like n=1 Tax=Asterias rubens TaxID=7604 RepID=UPI00145507FF|nr:TBC1 domain family member 7-like [Asterias rubens]